MIKTRCPDEKHIGVEKMKYVITIETPAEVANALQKNPKEAVKEIKGLMAQLKPEAAYFSTLRRFSIFVADVKDPHVELRRIYETLSKYGHVTLEPVSNVEEFLTFLEK